MVFNEDVVMELERKYPLVGMHFLLEMVPFWVRDERYWRNRKEWIKDGAIPGKLVGISIPQTVDDILINEDLWRVYQDKVPRELREDPAFRLEMVHAGFFYGVPCIKETPFLGRGMFKDSRIPVKDDIHNYWVQQDVNRYGENRVPPGYVDAPMVHHYCKNHRITPLEPKILRHLWLR